MKIFENGFLKRKYLNPDYRGLSGWNDVDGETIIATDGDRVLIHQSGKWFDKSRISIPQFTPEQIPEGELCWFGRELGEGGGIWWNLQRYQKQVVDLIKDGYCVPYLIARDEATANRLRHWQNRG